MIEGLYISASGMLPKSSRHETIANNLANAEVPGFKRDSLFMREVGEARKRLSGDYPEWRINRLEGIWTDFAQGRGGKHAYAPWVGRDSRVEQLHSEPNVTRRAA